MIREAQAEKLSPLRSQRASRKGRKEKNENDDFLTLVSGLVCVSPPGSVNEPEMAEAKQNLWWILRRPSAMAVAPDGDEGHLLQVGVVSFFVGAAIRSHDLLERGSRRQLTTEILHVHFIECRQVG